VSVNENTTVGMHYELQEMTVNTQLELAYAGFKQHSYLTLCKSGQ
jgi:hypothetical protein